MIAVTAGTLVRAARKSRGLTQRQLASRTGIDQAHVSRAESGAEDLRSGTIDRLLAGSGHRLYVAPTRRDDAATIATQIRSSLEAGDRQLALRHLIQLNDNLLAEKGIVRGVLAVAEPELTGQKVWDAAIAGLVAWRLKEEHVPLPVWVDEPRRILDRARVLRVDPADPEPTREDVPQDLLDHGVLAWQDTFASV